MTAELLFDGYYHSGPHEWQEWHAGVRMHGVRHYYTRFYPDGEWIHCCRDRRFDFWSFTESIEPDLLAAAKVGNAPRIGEYEPLCEAGTFTVDGGVVTQVFPKPSVDGDVWQARFEIHDDRLVGTAPNNEGFALLFQPRPDWRTLGSSGPSE